MKYHSIVNIHDCVALQGSFWNYLRSFDRIVCYSNRFTHSKFNLIGLEFLDLKSIEFSSLSRYKISFSLTFTDSNKLIIHPTMEFLVG